MPAFGRLMPSVPDAQCARQCYKDTQRMRSDPSSSWQVTCVPEGLLLLLFMNVTCTGTRDARMAEGSRQAQTAILDDAF